MYLSNDAVRAKENFNRDWKFRLLSGEEKEYRQVSLPHDWSLEYPFREDAASCGSGGFVETGIGEYVKTFDVHRDSSGHERIMLQFDGVYMLAQVWVNDIFVGRHVYGYTPFSLDITDTLTVDGKENVVRVKVDNSLQPGSRWYSGSGITRNVWICKIPETHIADYGICVRSRIDEGLKQAEVSVRTELIGGDAEGELTIETTLFAPDGKEIAREKLSAENSAAEGKGTKQLTFLLDAPLLWGPEHPFLYRAQVRILHEEQVIDADTVKFGIRSAEFDAEKGFLLNHVPTKLKGVCLHHDGGCVGAAVPLSIWKRRLEKLQDMGANALRFSHNPPDPKILDLCDAMGFLVMDEAFDEWKIMKGKELGSNTHESHGYSRFFDECHEEDIATMVRRDRNHPSVILWSIGNEVPEQMTEDGHLLAAQLKKICRELDPTRKITQANDQVVAEPRPAQESFLEELDIVGYNYMGRWRKRAETYCEEDKFKHSSWCLIGTESSSVGGTRGEYAFHVDEHAGWYTYPYFSAPVEVGRQLRYVMTRDYIAGDFIWTGIDYLGEARWPAHGASAGALDTCGFEKDSFYFYRSIWNWEKTTVHVLPHWNLQEQGIQAGQVIPVLGYTSCHEAELFVNGKSYGRKAKTYPAYGMTLQYGHFDTEPVPVHTNDLFLSWDVPYEPGELRLVGYEKGEVVGEDVVHTAGEPECMELCLYDAAEERVGDGAGDGEHTFSLLNSGSTDHVLQIEIALKDAKGNLCYQADNTLEMQIAGGYLKAVDNGDLKSMAGYRGRSIKAFHGKAFAVILPDDDAKECTITVSSPGMEDASLTISLS